MTVANNHYPERVVRPGQARRSRHHTVPPRQAVSGARRLAEATQAADRAKSAFLACASHELRTPLTSILGGLSLVLQGLAATPAEERELIQRAYDSSQHLLEIINDVLEEATLESGQLHAYPEPVHISPMVDEVGRLLRPAAEKKGLRLEWEPADSGHRVQADPKLLRQILVYLIVNAVKFTDSGHVSVSERLASNRLELIVADTGIGIALNLQAKLGLPFEQGDNSSTRRYGGLGLGLSLSRRLAELMGGSLTLHSPGEGLGSTFIVSLPLAPAGELTPAPGAARELANDSSHHGRRQAD